MTLPSTRLDSLARLIRVPGSPDLDQVFLMDGTGEEWTLREYRCRVAGTAQLLMERGVRPGDLVSWQLPTSFDAVTLAGALSVIGARQNPVLPLYGSRELTFILGQCRPDFFIARDLEPFEKAKAAIANPPRIIEAEVGSLSQRSADLDALADLAVENPARWIFYSSGTTAEPKGAVHTDASLIAGAAALAERYAMTAQDRFGMIFPFSHIGGLQMIVAQLLSGTSAILFERFAGEETFAVMRQMGATLLSGGTPGAQLALAAQRNSTDRLFPKLRAVMTGAAPKPPGLHRALQDELGGIGALSCYGMTEAPMGVLTSCDDPEQAKAETEGSPIPGASIRIVTADGRECGPGEVGEIRVKGPQVMLGYVDEKLNAGAFDPEGFFRTGDLGSIDAQGFVRVVGRLKDIIIRKGENISAAEVEDVIARHPDVAEAAAIGLPDPQAGEICCIVIRRVDASKDMKLAQIVDHCRQAGLARFKTPERIELVDEMPRNASGKIMKAELVRRFTDAADQAQ